MKLLTGESDPQRGTVVRPPKLASTPGSARLRPLSRSTRHHGNQRLWSALAERDTLYEKPEMSNEDGMRLGELEGIVGEEDGYSPKRRRGVAAGARYADRCTNGR
jgi:ATPase subunit of ABC transporter with duplicated ATPase domains